MKNLTKTGQGKEPGFFRDKKRMKFFFDLLHSRITPSEKKLN